jgi:hypothetical protein
LIAAGERDIVALPRPTAVLLPGGFAVSRATAVLLVAALAGPAPAQPPGGLRIADAKVEKDQLHVTEMMTVPNSEKFTYEEVVNGMKVTKTGTRTTLVAVPVVTTVALKNVKATDAAGKAIAADNLAGLLKEEQAVVVGPAPAKQRALFKDKTIFLELPPPALKGPAGIAKTPR